MNSKTLKLADVLDCADMKLRRCTHFLDKGVVPLGRQQNVRRGHHRQYSFGQAFELILAYRLSELGVPLRHLKKIIHAVHRNFALMKQAVSDGFSPFSGVFKCSYDWHFVMSRGEWVVVVPKEYVRAWLMGGRDWYSLARRQLERPAGKQLKLAWLQVPLVPIAECIATPLLSILDIVSDDTYNESGDSDE